MVLYFVNRWWRKLYNGLIWPLEGFFISVKCFGELAAFGRLTSKTRDTILPLPRMLGFVMVFLCRVCHGQKNALMVKREAGWFVGVVPYRWGPQWVWGHSGESVRPRWVCRPSVSLWTVSESVGRRCICWALSLRALSESVGTQWVCGLQLISGSIIICGSPVNLQGLTS